MHYGRSPAADVTTTREKKILIWHVIVQAFKGVLRSLEFVIFPLFCLCLFIHNAIQQLFTIQDLIPSIFFLALRHIAR